MWRPWHLFASVPDVQQGDTQTQRGTRKGTPPVWLMCVKSHNYSYLLKKPFPAHSPHLFFFYSSWFMWKDCTLDRLMVGWDFPPMLIALCGSVPITSFCLPHFAFGGECRRPWCEEWTQKSFTAVSNEASYQTDETVMDEMSLPHTPLCTLITTSISHLSKTKEVEILQNDNGFHFHGKSCSRQLFFFFFFLVERSESAVE